MRFLILTAFLLAQANAQITAKFNTTIGDFTVLLDHGNAPLATANFMLLAGLEDEEWTTPAGVTLPAPHVTYSPLSPGTPYYKNNRLALNVLFQESEGPGDVDKYIIRQSQTVMGYVSTIPLGNVYQELGGGRNIEIRKVENENKFQVVIKHPRRWYNNRYAWLQDAPMYRNIPITRIETGRRFFAGSFTNDLTETHGYRFPDELVRNPNSTPPWGTKFNTGWVLAMDNTRANTNGSRFFITGQPVPGDLPLLKEWNKRYTVVGDVLTTGGGRQVVINMLNLATQEDGTPDSEVNIQSIDITRQGGSDAGFFVHLVKNDLPGDTTALQLSILRAGPTFRLITPPTPQSQTLFLSSTSLRGEPVSFFSTSPPFNFESQSLDLTPAISTNPIGYFRALTTPLPSWPSREFTLSGAVLQCSNVLSSGFASGFVRLTMNTATAQNPAGSGGSYIINLPAMTLSNPDGSSTSYPAFQGSGTFTSKYEFEDNPYQGILTILTSTGNFPFDSFDLGFDFRYRIPVDDRVSRFLAYDADSLYAIEGVWEKIN
ncbi:MAG: peptidylprolyl isomerase [Verrucomicrobiaceae bacterium]